MLQALLEERFKLKTHWETKEGDVYNLVVAKGGPKLSAEGSMPPSADELKMFGDHPAPPLFQRNDGAGVQLYCAWLLDGPVGTDSDGAVWAAGDR